MKHVFLSVFFLLACAPAITVKPASAVTRTERSARGVELCVLYQENFSRPRFNGVAELSAAPWNFAIATVALKHPSAGLVLLDPAFGKTIAEELHRAGPASMLLFGDERTKTPLIDVMASAGLAPSDVTYALATHTHWDHVGALGDLPNARVLLSKTELEWVKPFTRFFQGGAMPHHLKRAKDQLATFEFTGPAVDGFASSFDVFGDGSIVALPLPGHTPGSTAYLVRDVRGQSWLFIGDTTWTSRGVELPAHKTLSAIDADLDTLSESVGLVAAIARHRPDVKVVPAHDGDALGALPRCGQP